MEDIDGDLVELVKEKRGSLCSSYVRLLCAIYAGPSQSFPRQDSGLPHLFPHPSRLRLEKASTNWLKIDSLTAPQVRYWYCITENSFIILLSH